ncbi:MAG TPA: hypothetical protein VGL06_14710 [Pseudonocardiaceae bacterium]
MDQANPFETPTTFRLHRAEYLVLFVAAVTLFVLHIHQVRWLPAVALFVYIDLIGYIPGAIAWHRSTTKRIPKAYYVLYNTMHSLVTQTVVVVLWGTFVGWEWALLVIPIHLFGDRGLFGNFLKPFALSFEPKPHPAYLTLRATIAARPSYRGVDAETIEPVPVPSGSARRATTG